MWKHKPIANAHLRFYPADSIARLIVAEIKGQGNLIGCIGLKVRSKRATSPVETNQVMTAMINSTCYEYLRL